MRTFCNQYADMIKPYRIGPGTQTATQYRANCLRKRLRRSFEQFLAAQQRRVRRQLTGRYTSGDTRRKRQCRTQSERLATQRTNEILALIYRPGIVTYTHVSGFRRARLDQLDGSPQD